MSFDIETYELPPVGYLPAAWLDESNPAVADHPDKYIRIVNGQIILHPMEDDESDWYVKHIQDGDEVEFCRYEDCGSFTITVFTPTDGDWYFTGGEAIDQKANCLVIDEDNDTNSEDIRTALETHFENIGGPRAGDYSLDAYHWSDGEKWRLTLKDGALHFIEVGGAEDVAH